MTSGVWTARAGTEAANVALVRRVMEAGFSRGDLAVCDELYRPDVVEHQRGNRSGVEGIKEVISALRSWFSDFRIDIEDMVAVDDMVWFRNRAVGTNDGRFMGFPPTGRRVELTVIDIVRISDGRIVEHWGVPDQLGAMLQLGLLPPPPAGDQGHGEGSA